MEKKLAISIANLIEKRNTATDTSYEVEKIETVGGTLQDFQQWSNGKSVAACFHVAKRGEESYYLVFIDWHRNDNYYLVIYPHDKSTTMAELHRTGDCEGELFLFWRYNPLKRDGKNAERKAYFQQAFGSTEVQIPLPQSPMEVEAFFSRLFTLSRNRQNADRIVKVFDL